MTDEELLGRRRPRRAPSVSEFRALIAVELALEGEGSPKERALSSTMLTYEGEAMQLVAMREDEDHV